MTLLLDNWPALVYRSLAKLMQDLFPTKSKTLKAKLILDHCKRPGTVVARLLGWNAAICETLGGQREEAPQDL